MEMFNTYNTHYNNYEYFGDKDTETTTVINKFHEDVYTVGSAFRCTNTSTNETRRCWQQSYTGILCIHSLVALISRITTSPNTESKESICRLALSACHSNWHRSTYSRFQDPTPLEKIPSIKTVVPSTHKNPEIWQRFREAAAFVPPEVIEQMILKIEVLALRPHTPSIRERPDTPGTTPERVLCVAKSAVQRTLFPTPSITCETQERQTTFFKESYPLTQTQPTNYFGSVSSCMIIPDSTQVLGTLSLSSASPIPDFQNQDLRKKTSKTRRRSQSHPTSVKRPKKHKRQPNRGSVDLLHQPFRKPNQTTI